MRMSPSMSVGDNAERLLGRLSASRVQSTALSDAADDTEQGPKVQPLSSAELTEWQSGDKRAGNANSCVPLPSLSM